MQDGSLPKWDDKKVSAKPSVSGALPAWDDAKVEEVKKKEPAAPSPSVSPSPAGKQPSQGDLSTNDPVFGMPPDFDFKKFPNKLDIQGPTHITFKDVNDNQVADYTISKFDPVKFKSIVGAKPNINEVASAWSPEAAASIQRVTERKKVEAETLSRMPIMQPAPPAEVPVPQLKPQGPRGQKKEETKFDVAKTEPVLGAVLDYVDRALFDGNVTAAYDATIGGAVNAVDKGIVSGVAGILETIGGANTLVTDALNEILPEVPTGVTLDPSAKKGMLSSDNVFKDAARYLRGQNENWDPLIAGSERLTKTVEGVSEIIPMLAAMEFVPDIKLANGIFNTKQAAIASKALPGMAGIDPVVIPKLATYIGTQSFFSTYGQARDAGAAPLEALAPAVLEAEKGVLTGTLFELFGHSASGMAQMVAKETGSNVGAAVTGNVMNALGFVLAGKTMTEVTPGGEYGADQAINDALLGVALGAKGVGDAIKGRAIQAYFETNHMRVKQLKKMFGDITPTKMQELRKRSEELVTEASTETDTVKKNQKLAAANVLNKTLDVVVVDKIVVEHGPALKEMIDATPEFDAQTKTYLKRRIDEGIAAEDPNYIDAKIITEEIAIVDRKIKEIEENTAMSPFVKDAQTATLRKQIADRQKQITDLYLKEPTVKKVYQAGEAMEAAPKNKSEYRDALVDVVGYDPKVAEVHSELAEMRANAWAKETGKKAEEWYDTAISKVRNEASYIKEMIASGRAKTEAEAIAMLRDKGTSATMGQEKAGAIEFDAQNKAIITAFKGADTSTLAHEALGHTYFQQRLAEHGAGTNKYATNVLKTVLDDFNAANKTKVSIKDIMPGGKSYVDLHEHFAKGFEDWLKAGQKSKDPAKQAVFNDFKKWMLEIYAAIGGKTDTSKGMSDLYKKMLGVEPSAKAAKEMLSEIKTEPTLIANEKETLQAETGKEVIPEVKQETTPEPKVETKPVVEPIKKEVPNAAEKRIKPKSNQPEYQGAPQGQPEVGKGKGGKRNAEVKQTDRGDSDVPSGKVKPEAKPKKEEVKRTWTVRDENNRYLDRVSATSEAEAISEAKAKYADKKIKVKLNPLPKEILAKEISIPPASIGISPDGSINTAKFKPGEYYNSGGIKVAVGSNEGLSESFMRLKAINKILKNPEVSNVIDLISERLKLLIDLPEIREMKQAERDARFAEAKEAEMTGDFATDVHSVFEKFREDLSDISQMWKEFGFENKLGMEVKQMINKTAEYLESTYSKGGNISDYQLKQLSQSAKGERKVIASVKGTDIKLDVPREVAGTMVHKTFGSQEKAEAYVKLATEAYLRNNPDAKIDKGSELYQTKVEIEKRAKEIREEEKDRINTKPVGSELTSPHETYAKATDSKGFDTGKNVWVRSSKDADNADRVLMVQISNSVINPVREGLIDKYLDKLYRMRPGYDRPQDFFEIPLWTAAGAHNLGSKGDFYAVRDIKEASEFIKKSGYKAVTMSALDVNAKFIMELAKANPQTKFLVGGYVKEGTFNKLKNVEWADSFDKISSVSGKPYTPGYSYKLFEATETMPRLKMSEGCRNKCAFCSIPKKVIETSKETIDQQVKDIVQLKAKLVYLDDKTFGEAPNYETLPELYRKIKEANPDFSGFVIQTTAPQMLKFTPEFLKESGIKYVELGIETFNDNILKALHKPTTEKISQKATDYLRENGIALIPNVIVGIRVKDANGKWIEESLSTYKKTLDYLKANKDIISHLNVYNLSLYEGTEINSDLNTQAAIDRNELVTRKTFHERPRVHEKAFDMFTEFGSQQLDVKPAMGGENYELYATVPQGKRTESKVAAVKSTIEQRTQDLNKEFFGSETPTSADIKAKPGFVSRAVKKTTGYNLGGLARLQANGWTNFVENQGDKVAAVAGKMMGSKYPVLRGTARLIDGLFANTAKTIKEIEAGELMGGSIDTARETVKRIAGNLYEALMGNRESLSRIDRVLDPGFYNKKTRAEYEEYLKENLTEEEFKKKDDKEIDAMYEALKNSAGWERDGLAEYTEYLQATMEKTAFDALTPAQIKTDFKDMQDNKKPGYLKFGHHDMTEADLLPNEIAVYRMTKKLFDLVHDMNYVLRLDDATYEKNKGKYSARFYKDYEVPEEISKEIEALSTKMELGGFKKRGVVDDWKMQHKLQDPIYAVSKRFAQAMANTAIDNYASTIVKESPEFVSDVEKPGFTFMGKGYGSLSGKYLRTDAAEPFKGIKFANEYFNAIYKGFRGYSMWAPRLWLKKGVTVYRPDVNLGNISGNFVFASMLGVSPFRLMGNMKYAYDQEQQYGDIYRYLLKKGILNPGSTLDDLKKASVVIENDIYGQTDPMTLAGRLKNVDGAWTSFYQNVDQWSKIAAFKSLVDIGIKPDKAAAKVAEGFQNFRRIGRIYDFASKTPVIGPPFAKFSGDLARIMKSASLKNPLSLAIFFGTMKMLGDLTSEYVGKETDDQERVRTGRTGVPKIPMFGRLGGSIPLEFKLGKNAVNLARFLSPIYGMDMSDRNDYMGAFMRLSPYNFATDESDKNTLKLAFYKLISSDILTAVPMGLAFDTDWLGKSITDPSVSEFHPISNLSPFDKNMNRARFVIRGWVPGYGQLIDDLVNIYQTMDPKTGMGLDKYGRQKSYIMALVRYAGYNAQVFDDAKYRSVVERAILKEAKGIEETLNALTYNKNVFEGKTKGPKMTKEEYAKKVSVILKRQDEYIKSAKKKIDANIRMIPLKDVGTLIEQLNSQQKIKEKLGLSDAVETGIGVKTEREITTKGEGGVGVKTEREIGVKK